MNLDDFDKVAQAAVSQIGELLKDWFSNGVTEGNEFCVGSISGEAGRSLRIRLTGDKAGYWSDFSSDGEAGRDLISLFAAREGLSQGAACARLAGQLGIVLSGSKSSNFANANIPPKPAHAPAAKRGGAASEAQKPRSVWEPIAVVPDDAGAYPVAHPVRGRPDAHWEYRDQDRNLLGVIYRFTTSDGGKEISACVYAKNSKSGKCEWRWMQFAEPRPLYLPGALRSDFPVLLIEGEKCADAAHKMLLAFDAVSWPGGSKAIKKVNWSLLAGRTVYLWADADAKKYKANHVDVKAGLAKEGDVMPEHLQPGMAAMLQIADILKSIGCTVYFVNIPAPEQQHGQYVLGVDGHDGWDIADWIRDGVTVDELLEFVHDVRPHVDDVNNTVVDDSLQANHSPETVVAEQDTDMPAWVTEPVEVKDDDVPQKPASAKSVSRKQVRSMMILTGNGGVKSCRENVFIAMSNDPVLTGLVGLNTFAMKQVKLKQPPWRSDSDEWVEADDFYLGMYLVGNYGLTVTSIGDIERGVAQAAQENRFNPVTDYLEACANKWDGQFRVETAFMKYWGVDDSEYIRLVSTMFFVGAVKRAFCPGVKHDNAPIFEGGQGAGKSTMLSILGGEWFSDTPFKVGDKDGYLAIQGTWIYEIAELEQFNKSEVTAIKAFMSSQEDNYREPYGRRTNHRPRQTVFGGTTNSDQYFKDMTGNRRFWPVTVGTLSTEGLREDRDQLLGEAVLLMRDGVKWYPTPEQQRNLISQHQEDRELPDEWLGRVYRYLEGIGESDDGVNLATPLDKVTGYQIITKALHIEPGKISQAKTETMRISHIMRKLGWIKKRETTGAREWVYLRPEKEAASSFVEKQTVVHSVKGGDNDLPI